MYRRTRSPFELRSKRPPIVGRGEVGTAGEESFGCCKAYSRGRASDRDDFARSTKTELQTGLQTLNIRPSKVVTKAPTASIR